MNSGRRGGKTTRRAFLRRLAACGALGVPARGALAMPARGICPELEGERIRWLVGAPPGGSFNRVSRLIEPQLEVVLGADVVVENVAGAGGLVGAHRLSRARPDGRTVGMVGASAMLMLPYTSLIQALDPGRDFDVLTRLRDDRQTLAVGRHLGVRTVEEIFRARKPFVIGGVGLGLSTFMATLFGEIFDIELHLVVGYQGSGLALAAIRRGELDGAIIDEHTITRVPALVPLVRMTGEGVSAAGMGHVPRLSGSDSIVENHPEWLRHPASSRALARALQTLAHAGKVAVAPRGLPPSLRRCLASAVFAAAASPEVAQRGRTVGQVLAPLPAAEARRAISAAREAASLLGSAITVGQHSGRSGPGKPSSRFGGCEDTT